MLVCKQNYPNIFAILNNFCIIFNFDSFKKLCISCKLFATKGYQVGDIRKAKVERIMRALSVLNRIQKEI